MSLESLSSAFAAVLWLSCQASVLAGCVLALQTLLGARLSPRWRSALWLLVVARLLLPVGWRVRTVSSIGSPPALGKPRARRLPARRCPLRCPTRWSTPTYFRRRSPGPRRPCPPPAPPREVVGEAALPASAAWKWPDAWLCATGGWVTVGGLLFGTVLIRSLLLGRRVKQSPEINDPDVLALFSTCACEISVRRRIILREAPPRISPAVCGAFRPALLLPANLLAPPRRQELRHVLLQ